MCLPLHDIPRSSDAIPHLSYASVEALLLEASEESPVRRTVEGWGRTVAGTVAGALVSCCCPAALVGACGLSVAWCLGSLANASHLGAAPLRLCIRA